MAYRYSNTEKWVDLWFSELKPIEKLLFIYLCDNCDIAGFIELNIRRFAFDLGTDVRSIEGALKGLARGLIMSVSNDSVYIRNFLKHQKNLPLNSENKAHIGILKRFELYSQKFEIKDVKEFIEGACKGLQSPTGNGNGIGNGIEKEEKKTFIKPSIEEFKAYFIENGYSEDTAVRAWNGYNTADWHDSKGNKIKNWKQKAQFVWFKDENRIKKSILEQIQSLHS